MKDFIKWCIKFFKKEENLYFVQKKIRVGKNVDFKYVKLDLAGENHFGPGSKFSGKLFLDKGSTIGLNCNFNGDIYIGKYSQIGGCVGIYSSSHPTNYLAIYTGSHFVGKNLSGNTQKGTIRIGSDVWIGHGAVILSNVNISDGVVVGAGSVVTRDIPPYAIVGGVPARLIKFRFSPDVIEKLLKIKWWDKSEIWIRSNIALFQRPINSVDELEID